MKHRFYCLFFLFCSTAGYAQQSISVGDIVSVALQKNYDVLIQQNTTASALTNKKYSSGVFLPRINGVGSYVKNNNDSRTINASDVERVINNVKSTNLNGSIQGIWTLFDGTRMFATRKRISTTAEQSELDVKASMNNTVATVMNNYYNIVRQKQQLKAIHEQMSVGEERVKLAEKKLQVGTGSKPELLQAKVDLNALRTATLLQEALITQLKDQLNGLAGMELPDGFDTADSIEINANLTLEEIVNDIESTNQTLLSAKKGMEVASAALNESRGSRYPTINLTSNYNFTKTETSVATSNVALLYNRNKGLNYGVSVSLPILNGFATSNLVSQARINVERQKLIYEQQKMIATVNARNAFSSYDNARKTLAIEEENILLAKENVSIVLETFRRGVATFIELRTAQQSLTDAYNRLIAARYNAKVAETELLRLKGALLK
jgi:outer membrane protein